MVSGTVPDTPCALGDVPSRAPASTSDAPLSPQALANPSATADTRSVMVYLSLQAHPALRQGLFAQGEIVLAQRDALAVPLSAITKESGRNQVLRINQGKVSKVNIKLGPHSGKSPDGQPMQEVIEGLQTGDVIVRNATGTVRDGQAVKLEQTASAPR